MNRYASHVTTKLGSSNSFVPRDRVGSAAKHRDRGHVSGQQRFDGPFPHTANQRAQVSSDSSGVRRAHTRATPVGTTQTLQGVSFRTLRDGLALYGDSNRSGASPVADG